MQEIMIALVPNQWMPFRDIPIDDCFQMGELLCHKTSENTFVLMEDRQQKVVELTNLSRMVAKVNMIARSVSKITDKSARSNKSWLR